MGGAQHPARDGTPERCPGPISSRIENTCRWRNACGAGVMHRHLLFAFSVASLLVACAGAGTDDGNGGAGIGGGADASTRTSTHAASASNSVTQSSSTGTALDAQLQATCTTGCTKVDSVSQMLGCSPTPDCVADCVSYGQSIGDCEDEYVALSQCAAINANTLNCVCNPSNGNTLSCDLCPSQKSALFACTGD